MKKAVFSAFLMALSIVALTQAPESFNYQVVVRDGSTNNPLANQNVSFKMSILKGSSSGESQYSELHSANTGDLGIVNLIIGNGIGKTGDMNTIDWGADTYFLKVEIDKTGGASYVEMGTTQLLSVPYALHSKTASVAQSVTGSIAGNLQPPVAVALPATDISPSTATMNGNVNGQGFSTNVVFEWGSSTAYGSTVIPSQSPVTGSADIAVDVDIAGLTAASTYHYRIKVSNAVNVSYSYDVTFTTQMVTTSPITSITPNSAFSGGTIVHDGGSPVTSKGVCWSTDPDPTINDSFTDDGEGTGTYVSSITGLSNSELYYVRAYATNSSGTFYGDNRTFITFYNVITDYDLNTYGTVLIGTQEWMGENLKTTHYRDGIAIEYPGSDNNAWESNTTGAYAWYDNDISWKDLYGALYNWYAVTNSNGLCPTGWHVPNNTEWNALTDYVGGASVAGGKLKSTAINPDPHPRWWFPNIGATNEYGFYGTPGGNRTTNGISDGMGGTGYFWTSSQYIPDFAYNRALAQLYANSLSGWVSALYGFSIRCIKD